MVKVKIDWTDFCIYVCSEAKMDELMIDFPMPILEVIGQMVSCDKDNVTIDFGNFGTTCVPRSICRFFIDTTHSVENK